MLDNGYVIDWKLIVEGSLGIAATILGILSYKQNNKIKALEEEKEYLKKKIFKVSSKVDPESDRKLVTQARVSIQIVGINSLGPLHHCREEIIEFLRDIKGTFQIILLNPTIDAFNVRAERERDSCCRLLSEWRASLSILKDIQIQTASKNIELRLRSDMPDRSLFIVDSLNGVTDTTKMLINYYPEEIGVRGYSGVQFLSDYLMERDRDSIFKNIDYYKKCWDKASQISIDSAIELSMKLK